MRSQPPFILGDFLAYTQTYLQTHHFVAAMGIVALVILSVELCLLVARAQARQASRERQIDPVAPATKPRVRRTALGEVLTEHQQKQILDAIARGRRGRDVA